MYTVYVICYKLNTGKLASFDDRSEADKYMEDMEKLGYACYKHEVNQ